MKFVSLPNHVERAELVTERTRKVAGAHVLFGAAINLTSGLVLVAAILSGRLVPTLLREAPRVLSEPDLIRYGGLVDPLVAWIAPACGVALLIVGALQVLATRNAFGARRWRRTVITSAAGLLNVLAVPMALIAVVLLYLSSHQFED